MDMLGNQTMRRVVTKYYEESGEPQMVGGAVLKAWKREKFYSDITIDTAGTSPSKVIKMK